MTSNIEWTDETWNVVAGCTRASRGCDHCYAVAMTHRLEAMGQERYAGLTVLNNRGDRHFNGVVRTVPEALGKPLKWKKPRRVFVNSMADLFHEKVPFEFVDRVFAIMALCPQHTFQVLTKRPERMAEYFSTRDSEAFVYERAIDLYPGNISDSTDYCEEHVQKWPLPNVWLGTSVEDQAAAEARIPHLLRCPASVRFLSCEPLLGAVDFSRVGVRKTRIGESNRIDWVIVGGESGAGARSCDLAWIRGIVSQCRDAGVACFVKQLGAEPGIWEDGSMYTRSCGFWPARSDYADDNAFILRLRDRKGGDPDEWPEDLRVREMPAGKASGIGH